MTEQGKQKLTENKWVISCGCVAEVVRRKISREDSQTNKKQER